MDDIPPTTAPLTPAIVSPVSRDLAVADQNRTTTFYVEVLGFVLEPGSPHVLVNGPAQLRLVNTGGTTVQPAIVFFEVNDVALMQAAIRAKGGTTSAIARANWIKVELFSLQDPDGHVLWFGKSFHEFYSELHTPPGAGQLRQIMPAFLCRDVPAAVIFYQDVLGFSINYQQHDLAVMDRDKIRLLLVQRTAQHQGVSNCCVYVRDADALYAELVAKGAAVPFPPVSQPWGLREFQVIDPESNVITFAQTFE